MKNSIPACSLLIASLLLPSCRQLPESGAKKTSSNAVLVKTLIDSSANVRVETWSVGSSRKFSALTNLDTPHKWRVSKSVLHGGRQENVDVVDVDNGILRFRIVPTRGMNIWDAHVGDFRLGWNSPVKEIVHPGFVNLDTRGGLGWLEGFGEMLNRCGLASFGAPGTDVVPSNTGAPTEVTLGLHGKISYLPASRCEVIIEPAPSRKIRIRGYIDETMMFGTQLRLVSEIWTEPGSTTIHFEDEIINLADKDQEMQYLYHCNFGQPLLDEGTRFIAAVKKVFPRDARAAEGGLADWDVYGPPQAGYTEQVYLMSLYGDENNQTETMLQNKAGDRGVSLTFSTRELPHFTLWKNTTALKDGYVTGIEPGTSYPMLRSIEREGGRVPVLKGGQSYKASLGINVLPDAAAVEAARKRIAALQGDRKTTVDKEPLSK
ncbi:MAG: aldose 1-epimerase family protein [Planctomycetota bacterium]|nr:aldose 1-epimerase family protein [Planctomycetota bacterium]